jgi:hypothetical protein
MGIFERFLNDKKNYNTQEWKLVAIASLYEKLHRSNPVKILDWN